MKPENLPPAEAKVGENTLILTEQLKEWGFQSFIKLLTDFVEIEPIEPEGVE
jgi:hypothetical protein